MLHTATCQLLVWQGNITIQINSYFNYPMTVRSRNQALPAKRADTNATVVELHTSRLPSSNSREPVRSVASVTQSIPSTGADLLSIRQHLAFKAVIGITDLSFIEQSYSLQVADTLTSSIRNLLDQEFGPLRVHRQWQLFVVSHHCMESLMAGLLRVQFHSREIPLPLTRDGKGMSDVCGVPLSWGVGETLGEAERARLGKLRT